MQKWEYKTLSYSIGVDEIELFHMDDEMADRLGMEGWELISCVTTTKAGNTTMILLFYKRPVKANISKSTDHLEKTVLEKVDLAVEHEVHVNGSVSRFFSIKDGVKKEIDEEQFYRIEKANEAYLKKHPDFRPSPPKLNITIAGKPLTIDTSPGPKKA